MGFMFNVYSGKNFREVFFNLRKWNNVICEEYDILIVCETVQRFDVLTDTCKVYYHLSLLIVTEIKKSLTMKHNISLTSAFLSLINILFYHSLFKLFFT